MSKHQTNIAKFIFNNENFTIFDIEFLSLKSSFASLARKKFIKKINEP